MESFSDEYKHRVMWTCTTDIHILINLSRKIRESLFSEFSECLKEPTSWWKFLPFLLFSFKGLFSKENIHLNRTTFINFWICQCHAEEIDLDCLVHCIEWSCGATVVGYSANSEFQSVHQLFFICSPKLL